MKVSFYLTRPNPATPAPEAQKRPGKKSKGETSIFARICYSGNKLKFYIPETINPQYWNSETQRAVTKGFREAPEFNARLDNIESSIRTIFRKYVNDHNHQEPQPETLKQLLDREIKKIEPKGKDATTFFGLFRQIIEQSKNGTRLNDKGKPISFNTYKTYDTVYRHLQDFQKTRKEPVDFNTIDTDFYTDYTSYLMRGKWYNEKTTKYETLNLSSNTIGKHIQIIKIVMNEATDRGINTNLKYKSKKFRTITEKTDAIYLNQQELSALENLDLSADTRLERVRDLFLVGCYTGLRFSDFSTLSPRNVSNGFIEVVQTKTGDPVVIPVHNTVKKILEKYSGNLPDTISNQKMNDYLKEIGAKVTELQVPTSKTLTKGGVKVIETHQKWELLTTHAARRSFASNEYLAGTPAITIMAITGHRTEKAFLGYIKLTPSEHAKLLNARWQERNQLKAV